MPTVAVLGASADRSKYGNKAVRAYQQRGFTVYPVNPKGGEIEGLESYASMADVPAGKLNLISVYLPPPVGLEVLDEVAKRGCDELWLN
ncbi:MAG TPA: CoA-binding protein, partial [Pirellulales bacterium]